MIDEKLKRICGPKLRNEDICIKILYNRAAYTLYIKAYIKYKNKDKQWCLPPSLRVTSLIGLPANSSTDKWQCRHPYLNIQEPECSRVRCLKHEMDMNTNAEGFH